MNYKQFNHNFPRYSRVTVKGWDLHENEVFEVIYSDPDIFILRSEATGIGYEVSYLCEDIANYSLAELTFDQIKANHYYLTLYGPVRVLAKSEIDQEIAIQFDDDSLTILDKKRVEADLNKQ